MRAGSEGRLYGDRKYPSLSVAISRHPYCSPSSVLDSCGSTARLIRRCKFTKCRQFKRLWNFTASFPSSDVGSHTIAQEMIEVESGANGGHCLSDCQGDS